MNNSNKDDKDDRNWEIYNKYENDNRLNIGLKCNEF